MSEYRLTRHLDWMQLHNQRVLIDVSENYIIALKRDGSFIILAQAIHPRQYKSSTLNVEIIVPKEADNFADGTNG